MLNPDGPVPSPKKQALQKKLATVEKSEKKPDREDPKHDKEMSNLITSKTKSTYKPPALKLSPSKKPHTVFNPKVKIDNSQVIDRTPTTEVNRETFMRRGKFSLSTKNASPALNLKGTNNKEVLLKRLREK